MVVVKRTNALELAASPFESKVLPNHVDNVDRGAHLVEDVGGWRHDVPVLYHATARRKSSPFTFAQSSANAFTIGAFE